jgi:hypothetical protein
LAQHELPAPVIVPGRPLEPAGAATLQRSAGNLAVYRLISRSHEVGREERIAGRSMALVPSPRRAVSTVRANEQLIQRDPPATTPSKPADQRDSDNAAIEAINIVNKNSTFKLKFESKPYLPGGEIEIKKVGLEIDGTNEISVPALTSAGAGTSAKGGSQATATTDPKKAAADTTAARVYAAELQARIPGLAETRVRNMLKFKATGEVTLGKEGKAAAGVALDTEFVSGEVMFNFLKVDLAAKEAKDRFKPLTAQIKIGTGKLLEHSFPNALRFVEQDADLKLRVKISGVIEVGPRWEMLEGKIVERFGKQALESYRASMVDTIAREESTMLVDELSEKIAKEATKDIADPEIREVAFREAKDMAKKTAAERGIDKTMVDVMAREAGAVAGEKTDLTAARAAMRVAAEEGATEAFKDIGRTVLLETVKGTLRAMSLKRLGASMMAALALGPIDIALAGLDTLAGALIEIIRAQQIEEMGMTAQLVRDNYVTGYRDGLADKDSGRGQAGGSPEGAAYIAGLTDGRSQFQEKLKAAMADRPELATGEITQAEIEKGVKDALVDLNISTDKILATATPKLEQMLIDAYVKANSTWFDKLFAPNVKESKSFKDFEQVVKTNLQPSATHTETANLSNGVKLTVTALDYTGENARRFRTQDGRYIVSQGGDTAKHSGWITVDKGIPLEDLYPNQEAGDKANQGSADQLAHMQSILNGLTVFASVTARGSSCTVGSVRLTGPGADDEQFAQYVRTADALAKTLGSFRFADVLLVYYPAKGASPGVMHLYSRGQTVTVQDNGSLQNLEKYAQELGVDTKDRDAKQAVGDYYWSMLSDTMLAAMPAPTLTT